MTKTIDTISEIVHAPKHALRWAGGRADKVHQHRYERRKTKVHIKLRDWREDLV